MSIDDLARAATGELWRTTVEHLDPSTGYRELLQVRSRRTRRRTAIVLVAVAAVVLAGWAGLRPQGAARSTPVDTGPSPVLVTPLCDHPGWRAGLPAPFDRPGRCPAATPAGSYASALVGVDATMPFTFTLPDGWTVSRPASLGGLDRIDGIDLTADGTSMGLTVFSYPRPVDESSGRVVSAGQIVRWLRQLPHVRTTAPTSTYAGNRAALSVDLRPTRGATFSRTCRTGRACLPVLETLFGTAGVAAELHPRTTSRLLLFDGVDGGLPGAVWVWEADDRWGSPAASLRTAMGIVASLRFRPAV